MKRSCYQNAVQVRIPSCLKCRVVPIIKYHDLKIVPLVHFGIYRSLRIRSLLGLIEIISSDRVKLLSNHSHVNSHIFVCIA